MKKVFYGWVGKNQAIETVRIDPCNPSKCVEFRNVWVDKGYRISWGDKDAWPPRRVKITVEDYE